MRPFSILSFGLASWCIVLSLTNTIALGDERRSTVTFRDTSVMQASHSEPAEAPAQEPALFEPSEPVQPPAAALPSPPPAAHPEFTETVANHTQPPAAPRVAPQVRAPMGFYVGNSARAALSQFPRRTPIQPNGPRIIRRQGKPFQNIERDPTLSPYLQLDRDEEDPQGIPNYFTYVRPQQEQLETNRMQQRELQQLRGQVQNMSPTVIGSQYQHQSGQPGGARAPARFMDTAQFYGGLR